MYDGKHIGNTSDKGKLEYVVKDPGIHKIKTCLLYTSDAADERSSVDLGGRRIIKKKKSEKRSSACV